MIKNVVHGGRIKSKNDGDWHYISAHKLVALHRLKPSECYLVDEHDQNEKMRGFNDSQRKRLPESTLNR